MNHTWVTLLSTSKRPYGDMAFCTNVHMYKYTGVQTAVCSFCRMYIYPDGLTAKRQDGIMYTRSFVQTALWPIGQRNEGTQGHTAYCPFIRKPIRPNGYTAERPYGFSAARPYGQRVHDIESRTRKKNGKMCFCTYKLPFARTKTTCHLRPVAAETIAPKSQSDGKTPEKITHKNPKNAI